ncbi:hypothetical protein P0O24_00640 [Methanotrichaceae archaeon M04Ac]|uniref:Uncharacterized protein n=1 Tax=Candidatus Methanocrinis alkalitolerans TaxID=3033395 RepID=A0ABT5XBK3_9EURY|nr:hypothetical protein [Candidatus Methanocrinis alkalitolerans]MDF0592095.1 hypothetical protein [Candidatus Methanocrinis alkalitolerans]
MEQLKKTRLKSPLFLIRSISFSTPEADRRRLAEELAGLCAAGRFDEVLEAVAIVEGSLS